MIEPVVIKAGDEEHLDAVRRMFLATYAHDYPYRHFLDAKWLKRSVYSDNLLMLVAEDSASNEVIGTASIILDVGRHSDLLGEFGRLVVHPDARRRGIGQQLMQARLDAARSRLHVAIVEARTAHLFSQKIAFGHGFVPVGFLPNKHRLAREESVLLGVQYFGAALELRRNNPRIVPEVKPLAHLALRACGLTDDTVIDSAALAYPDGGTFSIESLTSQDVSPLLRIERGRSREREVFGPTTLQHGFFKITENAAEYLVARDHAAGHIAGAIGLVRDPVEDSARIFELVFADEQAVRALLSTALTVGPPRYLEIDVRADATRLQKTLDELGFVAAAYVPAMVFADVERVDIIRFVWLASRPPEPLAALAAVVPAASATFAVVRSALVRHRLGPETKRALARQRVLKDATPEQLERVFGASEVLEVAAGQVLFHQGSATQGLYLLLDGRVSLQDGDHTIAEVRQGQPLAEVSVVTNEHHSVTAVALTPIRAAFLSCQALTRLLRDRPDVAAMLYRNLAVHLGAKLGEMNQRAARFTSSPPEAEQRSS